MSINNLQRMVCVAICWHRHARCHLEHRHSQRLSHPTRARNTHRNQQHVRTRPNRHRKNSQKNLLFDSVWLSVCLAFYLDCLSVCQSTHTPIGLCITLPVCAYLELFVARSTYKDVSLEEVAVERARVRV
jgi:hypothetical protein